MQTLIVPVTAYGTFKKPKTDFKTYLEQSLKDPFTLNLKNKTLMEVIDEAVKVKSRRSPDYARATSSLRKHLRGIEEEYQVTLRPIQITDIFWDNFIAICLEKGLKPSTIETLANQLRSILNWAVKHGAEVSPTYGDVKVPQVHSQQIALTADEVSRVTYFDIDRFYRDRRADFRDSMKRVRDMFVLSVCLYQRHSDMLRISKSCFDRNIFSITQQKTGNRAIVNIDKYSVNPKAAYAILERYDYEAPYKADIGKYNKMLHILMRDIGFTELIRIDERYKGELVSKEIPKWQMISSHTARRTAITVGVQRGHNMHSLKKASGHSDLRIFDRYIRDETA